MGSPDCPSHPKPRDRPRCRSSPTCRTPACSRLRRDPARRRDPRGKIVGGDAADKDFALPRARDRADVVLRVRAGADDRAVPDPAGGFVVEAARRSCGGQMAMDIACDCADRAVLLGFRRLPRSSRCGCCLEDPERIDPPLRGEIAGFDDGESLACGELVRGGSRQQHGAAAIQHGTRGASRDCVRAEPCRRHPPRAMRRP